MVICQVSDMIEDGTVYSRPHITIQWPSIFTQVVHDQFISAFLGTIPVPNNEEENLDLFQLDQVAIEKPK